MLTKIGARAPNSTELEQLNALQIEDISKFFDDDQECFAQCRAIIMAGPTEAETDYQTLQKFPHVIQGLLPRLLPKDVNENTTKITQAVLTILNKGRLKDEKYPLHAAITAGDSVALELLLKSGAYNINAFNDKGNTVLHDIGMDRYNQISNRIALLKLLFKYGADPYILSKHYNVPAKVAFLNENHEVLKLLMEYGQDIENINLKKCFKEDERSKRYFESYIETLPYLAGATKDERKAFFGFYWGESQYQPERIILLNLFTAYPKYIQAYPEKASQFFKDFLENAMYCRQFQNPSSDTKEKRKSPYSDQSLELLHKQLEEFSFLKNASQETKSAFRDYFSGIGLRELKGKEALIRHFVEHPQFICDFPKLTTCFLEDFLAAVPVVPDHEELFSELLNNLDAPGRLCVLENAIKLGHLQATRLVILAGVDLSSCYPTNSELTPLHHAVKLGNCELINLLLQNGVHINTLNSKNQTPLELVLSEKSFNEYMFVHKNILFLLDHGAKIERRKELVSSLDNLLELMRPSINNANVYPIVQALITRGANPSAYYASEILTKSLEKGHYGLALLCLEKMPQLRLNLEDWQHLMKCQDPYLPIHIAEKMFARGMGIDDNLSNRLTLFDCAYQAKNTSFAGYLASKGARLNPAAQKDAVFMHYLQQIKNSASTPATQRLRHLLTLGNLGHLVGDAFLYKFLDDKGEKVEGGSRATGISLTFCLLDSILETRAGIFSEHERQQIEKMSQEMKDSYEFAWSLTDAKAHKDKLFGGLNLKELSRKLQKRILEAGVGQVIPVPLGWNSPKGGHAIMASFSRLENGKIQMRIVNTGAGAANAQSNKVQMYVALEEVFEFTEKDMVENQYLYKLLEPIVLGNIPKHLYGEDQLKFVLDSIRETMGTPVVSKRNRKAQASGTCTVRCQLANLQAVLGDEIYKKLSLPMKIDVAELAIDQNQLSLPHDKPLRKLLHLITSNLARRIPLKDTQRGLDYVDRLHQAKRRLVLAANVPKYTPATVGAPTKLFIVRPSEAIGSTAISHKPLPPPIQTHHPFPKILLEKLNNPQDLLDALDQFAIFINKADSSLTSPIVSEFLIDFSLGMIRAYKQKETSCSSLFEALKTDPKACESLIEKLASLTEVLAKKEPSPPSIHREIAGQATLCAAWIISSVLEDAQGIPKGHHLRVDDFGLNDKWMEHIVAMPGILEENPPYLLTDPQVNRQAVEIYEFMKEKRADAFFDFTKHFHTSLSYKEDKTGVLRNSQKSHEQGNHLTLRNAPEYQYCKAYVNKKTREDEEFFKDAMAAHEKQAKLYEEEGKLKLKVENFNAHWLFVNKKLPMHFYHLQQIALNSNLLRANYAEVGIANSLNLLSKLKDTIPTLIPKKTKNADVLSFVVAYLKDQEFVSKYLVPDLLNKTKFLPLNSKDVSRDEHISGLSNNVELWPLYISYKEGVNALWVAPKPNMRRLFALREHVKPNISKFDPSAESDLWNTETTRRSNLLLSQMVDYFSENSFDLEKQPQRLLMLYTLCEPGRLKKAVEDSPEFANELHDFFVNKINVYKDRFLIAFDLPTTRDTLSFLYQCHTFLLTSMDPEAGIGKSSVSQALGSLREEMKMLINDELWSKDPHAVMHLCLDLVASYQNRSKLKETDAVDLLHARFLYKQRMNQLPDKTQAMPNVSPQFVMNTWSSFATKLEEIQGLASDKVLSELARRLGVVVPDGSQWEKQDYPIVSLSLEKDKRISLSLSTGTIVIDGVEIGPIPAFISDDSYYIKLFGTRSFPCKESDGAYEGMCDGILYRFEYNKRGNSGYLHTILSFRDNECYEFVRSNSAEFPDLPKVIPELLPEGSCQSNQPLYYIWKKRGYGSSKLFLVSPNGKQQIKVNERGHFLINDKWYKQCGLTNLQGSQTILDLDQQATLWQEVSEKPEYFIKMPSYIDESGKRLAFKWVLDDKTGLGRWILQSAPHLSLSLDQSLTGFGYLKRYLIVENDKKERYLLLPKLDYQEQTDPKVDIGLNTSILRVKLEKGTPLANEPEKLAMLAYHKLLSANDPQDYIEVMHYLEKAKKFGRYTPEELRIFGWIYRAYKTTKDHTILGNSIRLYTLWLVEDNFRRNPTFESNISKLAEIPKSHAEAKDWETFWMSVFDIKKPEKKESITFNSIKQKLAVHYLTHHHRLPAELRLENLIDAQEFLNFKLESYASQAGKVKELSFNGEIGRLHINHLKELLKKPAYSDIKLFPKDSKLLLKEQLKDCFSHLYLIAHSSSPQDRQKVRQIIQDSATDDYCYNDIYRSTNMLLRMILGAVCDSEDAPMGSKLAKAAKEIKAIMDQITTTADIKNDPYTVLCLEKAIKTYMDLTLPKSKDRVFDRVAPAELFNIEEVRLATKPKRPELFFDGTFQQPTVLTNLFKDCLDETEEKAITGEFVPFTLETNDPSLLLKLEAFNEDCRLGHEQLANASVYKLKTGLSEKDLLNRREEIRNSIQKEQDLLKVKEAEILNFAAQWRESLNDPLKILEAKIGEVSGSQRPLAIEDYIGMYVHADLEVYERMTRISDKDKLADLHRMVGAYLLHSTSTQAMERTDELLNKLQEAVDLKNLGTKDPHSIEQEIQDLIQNIAEEAGFVWQVNPQNDHPALVVFQERMGVALKTKQLAAVRELMRLHPQDSTRFLDIMVQLIQGGGKTFFIAPTIALIKADGYHASFLVSPTSQIATNLPNMRTISAHAYGQHERTLVFDDSPQYSTPQYLNWMLGYIKQTIHNRAYFNVTKETLRALLCKETKKRIQQTDPLSYKFLKEIRKLIKERGAFTFDEAHKAFSPWMLLNMPFGKPYSPDPQEVSLMASLFKHALLVENEGMPSLNVIHSADQDPVQLHETIAKAAKALLSEEVWQRKLGLLDKDGKLMQSRAEELDNFVFGKIPNIPKFLEEIKLKMGEEACAADLATLLMASVHRHWLVDRLLTRIFVNHGKCELPGQPTISRPFKANMKPEKDSDFSDIYVMVYNTLIAYAADGLSLPQVKDLIIAWRQGAIVEHEKKNANNPDFTLADTKKVKQFYEATKLNLYRIDENLEEDLLKVQRLLKERNRQALELLFDYVAEQEISKVELYPTEISSNGQDTAAMARSQNSFSGSADNPYMLPSGTTFVPDKGTNGQTIALIRNKKTEVWAMDKEYSSIFTQVIDAHPERERIRAIVDVGAHFVGMTNEDVAEMICKHNKNPQIEKVLYFATDSNELYAMDVADPTVRTKISETSEKVILEETGVGPEQRFTYYDNYNMEGTDILQMWNACAAVIINAGNTTTEHVQGEQRLRNLKGCQQIFCAAHVEAFKRIGETLNDSSLKNAAVPIGKTNVPIESLQLNAHLQLEKKKPHETLLLAIQKIQAALKVFVQSKLDPLTGDQEKQLSKATEYLFLRNVKRQLYREFAHKPESKDSITFLEDLLKSLIQPLYSLPLWFNPKELDQLEKNILEVDLKPIYNKIPPTIELHKDKENRMPLGFNQTSTQTQFHQQTQVQQQKFSQKQKLQMKQTQQQFQYNQKSLGGLAAPCYKSKISEFLELTPAKPNVPTLKHSLFVLKDVVNLEEPKLNSLNLSPNIYVDSNFVKVFSNRTDLLSGNRKSIEQIALIQDKGESGNNSWRAIILDQTTAREVEAYLCGDKPLEPKGRKVWIVRATGQFAPYNSKICPQDNTIFNDPEVKKLMTQILFISGNVTRLNRQPWLNELDQWLPKDEGSRLLCKHHYENTILYGNITRYKKSALRKILKKGGIK